MAKDSKLFYGSIDLTKLIEYAKTQHSAFSKSDSNEHIYVNINVWDNGEKDQYGNQLGIQLSSTKEAREAGEEQKIYIGNAKPSEKTNTISEVKPEDVDKLKLDDLPF